MRELSLVVLSEREIEEIHEGTLEVLESTGVKVLSEEGREILRKGGAKIEGDIVFIPPSLVEQSLKSTPSEVIIKNRDGEEAMSLGGRNTYFGTGSDCPFTRDLETGERRPTLLKDIESLTLLTHHLPNLDFVMSMGLAKDKPTYTADVWEFFAMVNNTTKPIVFTAFTYQSLKNIHEICKLIRGGEEEFRKSPFVVHYAEPTSPLIHSEVAMNKLIYCAEKEIPVNYSPAPMAGGTAPVTLAGTIILANAEILSGLVVHQLKNPGAPFIYGAFVTIMDMSTGVFSYGAPELILMSAGMADMARYYHLPSWSQANITDSKILDCQGGMEYGVSCLMACLSGANLVHDCGYLESGLTSSHESILMANEVIGVVRRIREGIRVEEDYKAIKVIRDAGAGGSFIGKEHTLQFFRKEFFLPSYLDRKRYPEWIKEGGKSLEEKLKEGARKILKEASPPHLPSKLKKSIEEKYLL